MTTISKEDKGIAGTGTGAAIEAMAAQLTPREARILRRVKRRQDRAAVHAAEISHSRLECEARRGLRVAAMPAALGCAIAADKAASKIRRKSVRNAIAAHDACLVPAAGSSRAGRGGWQGASRIEAGIWRGAARLAESIYKRHGKRGPDTRSGVREIVFGEVPSVIGAISTAETLADLRAIISQAKARISPMIASYLSRLRDDRRRRQCRENEASGPAGMDDWEDRDEFSGGACSPWPVIVAIEAGEGETLLRRAVLGDDLPALISSDPRRLTSGGAGLRRGVAWGIVHHAPAVVGAALLKSIEAAAKAGSGKGAHQRMESARTWQTVADCVAIVTSGGILPPEERAGLSNGPQGGIGKAWERRIEKLRAEIGGKVDPLSRSACVPDLPPVAAQVGTLGAAMDAAGV